MIKTKRTAADIIYDSITTMVLILVLLIVAYPLYFIITASISDPNQVRLGKTLLLPIDPTLDGYVQIFRSKIIWRG